MTNIEEVAKSIHKAFKGIGTDEKRLIKEIISVNNQTRQLVKEKYLNLYGKTLEEDLKSEIGGKFLDGVLALIEEHDIFDAKNLRKAIHGVGTNEKVVIQTLCTKDGNEIQNLRAAYHKLYNKNLDEDIRGEENGPVGRIFRSIAAGGRATGQTVDSQLAKEEAQQLYDAGEGKFGTDESEFVRILCSRSFNQLNSTFAAYASISGNDIEKAIKKEMSGDLEKACLAIVECSRNKPAYFARALHEAMSGAGTEDDDLIRLLVSRSDIDLNEIENQYKSIYGKTLHDAVKSELSGDYEKLFLALIDKN